MVVDIGRIIRVANGTILIDVHDNDDDEDDDNIRRLNIHVAAMMMG